MTSITRRTVLKAAPALGAAAAVPAMAASQDGDSEIMRIFWQWVASRDAINNFPGDGDCPEEWHDAHFDAECEMLAIPAQTAEEMAAKFWIWTCFGTNEMVFVQDDLIYADARRILGLDGRHVEPVPLPESDIMRLFREWQHLQANYPPEAADLDEDDAIMSAHNEKIWAVEERMLAMPSADMMDIAAKLAARSNYGDLAVTANEAPEIWAEVRRLLA